MTPGQRVEQLLVAANEDAREVSAAVDEVGRQVAADPPPAAPGARNAMERP
jgi:hypothetical protein